VPLRVFLDQRLQQRRHGGIPGSLLERLAGHLHDPPRNASPRGPDLTRIESGDHVKRRLALNSESAQSSFSEVSPVGESLNCHLVLLSARMNRLLKSRAQMWHCVIALSPRFSWLRRHRSYAVQVWADDHEQGSTSLDQSAWRARRS